MKLALIAAASFFALLKFFFLSISFLAKKIQRKAGSRLLDCHVIRASFLAMTKDLFLTMTKASFLTMTKASFLAMTKASFLTKTNVANLQIIPPFKAKIFRKFVLLLIQS